MTRTRSLFAAALLALSVPAAIAGCGGGGGSDQDPQEVIDATFNNDQQVTSGVLDLSLEGSAGDQGNFTASLTGPFQTVPDDPTALPKFDLTATASGEGGGQSIDFEGGLTITDDNLYVEYKGQAYEIGTDTFSQLSEAFAASAAQADQTSSEDAASGLKQQCEQAVEQSGGDVAACDFDVAAWFTSLTNDGSEDLDGTSVVHVSGDVDVAQMLNDLAGISEAVGQASASGLGQLGGLSGGAGGGTISQAQIDQATEAISGASFDLYSGEDDDILRKLDVNVIVDPSAVAGATPVPVDSIDFGFSVGLSDVNSEQTIEGPADAKPINELIGQFGLGGLVPPGAGGLGG